MHAVAEANAPPGMWMCTDVTEEPVDLRDLPEGFMVVAPIVLAQMGVQAPVWEKVVGAGTAASTDLVNQVRERENGKREGGGQAPAALERDTDGFSRLYARLDKSSVAQHPPTPAHTGGLCAFDTGAEGQPVAILEQLLDVPMAESVQLGYITPTPGTPVKANALQGITSAVRGFFGVGTGASDSKATALLAALRSIEGSDDPAVRHIINQMAGSGSSAGNGTGTDPMAAWIQTYGSWGDCPQRLVGAGTLISIYTTSERSQEAVDVEGMGEGPKRATLCDGGASRDGGAREGGGGDAPTGTSTRAGASAEEASPETVLQACVTASQEPSTGGPVLVRHGRVFGRQWPQVLVLAVLQTVPRGAVIVGPDTRIDVADMQRM